MLNRVRFIAAIGVVTLSAQISWGCGDDSYLNRVPPKLLAQFATLTQIAYPTPTERLEMASVCAAIRTHGYDGLECVIQYREQRIAVLGHAKVPEIQRIDRQVDKIAAQKFSAQSQLFWYTSREQAQHVASRTGRPVLSLRMLGRLDEDLSCANSRFFRTILYPDPKIRDRLRNEFVLHWEPVRNVPVVTIDFGDGRTLRQPLVGNSVHLLLTPSGQVIDAMPGLVNPESFHGWLTDVTNLWAKIEGRTGDEADTRLRNWHRNRADRRRSESSLAISASQSVADLNPLDPRWNEIASHANVELASVSRDLLNQQQPQANAAMRIAPLKSFAEAPLLRMVQPIEPRLALDDAFNRYALQTKLDDWYSQETLSTDYEAITQQIYEQLFLMPLDDPWLGLSTSERYVALDGGGQFIPKPPKSLSASVTQSANR